MYADTDITRYMSCDSVYKYIYSITSGIAYFHWFHVFKHIQQENTFKTNDKDKNIFVSANRFSICYFSYLSFNQLWTSYFLVTRVRPYWKVTNTEMIIDQMESIPFISTNWNYWMSIRCSYIVRHIFVSIILDPRIALSFFLLF